MEQEAHCDRLHVSQQLCCPLSPSLCPRPDKCQILSLVRAFRGQGLFVSADSGSSALCLRAVPSSPSLLGGALCLPLIRTLEGSTCDDLDRHPPSLAEAAAASCVGPSTRRKLVSDSAAAACRRPSAWPTGGAMPPGVKLGAPRWLGRRSTRRVDCRRLQAVACGGEGLRRGPSCQRRAH